MEQKYRVVVDMTIEDGRAYFHLSYPKEQHTLNLSQIRSILSGSVALTIRGSENEAQAMKEVINYLESEFVSTDSFDDISIKD